MNRNIVTIEDAAAARLAARRAAAGVTGLQGRVAEGQPELLAGDVSSDAKPDAWFERLAKYVPTEAVGLYLALAGLVTSDDLTSESGPIWLGAVLATCVAFNSLFLRLLWKVHRWSQIIVSDVALVAYVFATGGLLIQQLRFYEPRIGTLTLVVVTAFLVFFCPPADARKVDTSDPS